MQYESRSVSPTAVISEGWELIKSDYWLFFAMTLVMALIVIAVSWILNLAVSAVAQVATLAINGASGSGQLSTVAALVPLIITQLFGMVTNFIAGLLSALLVCGIYVALSRKASGGEADFGDLFAGFKFFQPCLIVALFYTAFQFVIGVIAGTIGIVMGASAYGAGMIKGDGSFDPSILWALIPAFFVMLAFYLILMLIFSVLTFFIYQLISARNASGVEAITQSVRAGWQNFLPLIGLLILEGLMAFGGALLCIVGIFFVIPILFATNYAAFLRVFGRPTNFAQNMPPPPPIFR